ncbi:MAG: helix-turn-helix domain-containing protein [Myxococcota bacterium]
MQAPEIRALRNRLELTQQAFASLLGLSFVSVNRWEQGHSTPTGLSLVLLQLVANALDRSSPAEVARQLREVGPDPLAIIRTLVHLEGDAHAPRRP